MIHSMTGFGDAQHEDGGVSYALEIRSLNNRHFKPTIKLPEYCQSFESGVDKLLRARLGRGSVTYTLRVRDTRADAAHEINRDALRSYLSQLAEVVGDDGLPVSIDLGTLLALPGVCQPPPVDAARRDQEWEIIRQLTNTALDKLVVMRAEEGRALRADLVAHCDTLRRGLMRIAELAPLVVTEYHQRLRTRVNQLLSEAKLQLDETDLIKEVAIFAERCDIAEETSRFISHLDQFTGLCDQGEQAGRRLDFLSQELLREANTISSKANKAEISREVVEIKGLIDRLKEQVQNVE